MLLRFALLMRRLFSADTPPSVLHGGTTYCAPPPYPNPPRPPAPRVPVVFVHIDSTEESPMPTIPTQADPIAALRAVLAENARIPALETEIAHLRGKPEHAPAGHLLCPFCGGSATVSSASDASIAPKVERWNATALCRSCGATGPSATGSTHTEGIANAWAAWDRRDGGAR